MASVPSPRLTFREWSSFALVVAASVLWGCGGGAPPAVGEAVSALGSPPRPAEPAGPTDAARAAQGLAISPVPLRLEGKSAREKERIGLGSYIVNAASDCAGCHSTPAGFLGGGNPFELGNGQVVRSRNLTPDPTTGLQLTRDQFVESIRTGRDFHAGQTRMLVVMPWTTLRWASDRDLDAIYAYLRAVPPVKNAVPPDVKDGLPLPPAIPFDPSRYTDGVVVRELGGAGQSFPAGRGRAISPVVLDGPPEDGAADGRRQRSVGVGSYVANALAHCNDCHTHPDRTPDGAHVNTASFLTGGTVFTTPPPLRRVTGYVRATSANLQGARHGFFQEPGDSWTRFQSIIRTGTLVDETPPRPLAFPMMLVAPNLARLLEWDLRAVYDYMKAVPPTPGPSDLLHQPPARWCAAASDCGSGEACTSGECTGGSCSGDLDCGTCQTCGGGTCHAPAPDSICVLTSQ